MSTPLAGSAVWDITFANLGLFSPTDVVTHFEVRAVDPNPASPRGTAEHLLITGFLATTGGPCPAGTVPANPGLSVCPPSTSCPPNPITISVVGVPIPCPCDRNGDGQLDQTDINDFLAAYTAQNPSADFNHDGVINSADFYAFFDCFYASNPQMCSTVTSGQTPCPTRPTSLTLQYTGQSCAGTSTTQAVGQYHCSDVGAGPNNDPSVYIVVSEKTGGTGKIYFSGPAALGGTFVATTANVNPPPSNLGSKVFITIYSDASRTTVLQSVDFKTDCSQPLRTGDRFGASRVVDFAPNSGTGGSTGPVCNRFHVVYDAIQPCAGDGSLVATIQADCLPARTISTQDVIELCCQPGQVTDLCGTSGGHPTLMTLRYTGTGCSGSHNSMAAGKVVCTDIGSGPNNTDPIYITATDSATPGAGHVFFSGFVPLNGSFTVSATAGGLSQLTTNTYFYFSTTATGPALENLSVHTSCSQPLIPGEQYGTIQLLSLTTTTGATSSLPVCTVDDTTPGLLKITADHAVVTVRFIIGGQTVYTKTLDLSSCP